MGELYDAAFEKFSNKYGISHNIYNEYSAFKKVNRAGNFVFESTPEIKQAEEKKAYLSTLQSVLTTYLQSRTKYEAGKSYDMSDVSLGEFIEQFDQVMSAINADEGEEHTPYAGFTLNQVSGETWKRISSFNKPLHELWGKQIRKGTLSIEQLQRVTDSSISLLDRLGNKYNKVVDKDLANVIMAKNAMEAAKKERSWLWWLNPRNWGPYGRENDYLKDLKRKIESYRTAGFPVDGVVPESYGTNIFEKAHDDLITYVQIKPAAAPVRQKAPAPQKAPANEKVPVVQPKEPEPIPVIDKNAPLSFQIDQIKSHDVLFEPHCDALIKIAGRFTKTDLSFKKTLLTIQFKFFLNPLQILNSNLENNYLAYYDSTHEETVREMALKTFETFYQNSPSLFGIEENSQAHIAVAQAMTDYYMKTFSPVSQNPEKYGKYADNYIVKVQSYLTQITGIEANSRKLVLARNLLNVKSTDVIKEPENIISEVEKEDPKIEEIKEESIVEEIKEESKADETNEEANNNDGSEIENAEEVNPRTAIFNKLTEIIDVNLDKYKDIISYNEISDYNDILQNVNRDIVSSNFNPLEETIRKYNEQFANLEIGETETMREMAKAVFAESYKLVKKCTLPDHNYILAAQKVANYVMGAMSPAAVDNEKYGEYADNYVLKDYDILTDALGDEILDIDGRKLDKAREELEIELDAEMKSNESIKRANHKALAQMNDFEDDIAEAQNYYEDEPDFEFQNEAEESNVEYEPVDLERIEAKFSDENELNELLDEISYSIEVPDDNAKDLLMQSSLLDKIKSYNQLFNKVISEDVKIGNHKLSAEDVMKKMAIDVFKEIYEQIVKANDGTYDDETLIAAQRGTNYILEELSPQYTNKKAFGKYIDNYLFKNEPILAKAMGVEKVDPEVLQEVREEKGAFPFDEEEVDNLGDILPKADGPVREKLGLKLEDLEKPAPEQNLSAKANEVPVKGNNNLSK